MPVTTIQNSDNLNNLSAHLTPVNSVLKQSYDHAKKQLQDGVNAIQQGYGVIKDEFIGIYDKAAGYMQKFSLPVNNFLKDLAQIEAEFQAENSVRTTGLSTPPNCIIPIEEAIKGRMEENY